LKHQPFVLNKKYSVESLLICVIKFLILIQTETKLFCQNDEFNIKQIPPFSLKAADGKLYENKDLKGKNGVIIMFLSNHCKYSQIYKYYLNDWNSEWKRYGFSLFVFSPNHENSILPSELAYTARGDSYKEMKEKHEEKKFNFPFIYDGTEHVVTNSLNATITPSVYLFNESGLLIYTGRIGNHEEPNNKSESEFHANIKKLISRKEVKFNRTHSFGKAIRFKEDLESAEKVKKRYAEETVNLYYADEKKITLLTSHNIHRPTFFYVWSLDDNKNDTRENLIKISKYFKIFRKRGLKVITICICKELDKDKVKTVLERSQLSSFNYYTYPTEVKNLIKLRPEEGKTITPFGRLVRINGRKGYSTNGQIDDKEIRIHFLNSLNEK
jgi:hypothetical protein